MMMITLVLCLLFSGVSADNYWSFQPATTAAGEIPSYAVVTFDIIGNAVTAWGQTISSIAVANPAVVALKDYLDITYLGGQRCEVPGCNLAGTDTWKPFNRYAPYPFYLDTAPVITTVPASASGTGVYHVVSDAGLTFTPLFTSTDAGVLRLLVTAINPLSVTAPPTVPVTADYPVRIFLPWFLLASNPDFPGVQIYTSLTLGISGVAIAPMTVLTPWTTTNTETELSQLQFISLIPSDVSGKVNVPNTIASSALSGLSITFHPGIQTGANGFITLYIHGGLSILAAVPGAPTTPLPTVAIGPNCGTSPSSLYCCSASTVATTLPPTATVAAGSFWGTGAFALNNQLGWSTAQLTLLPSGCIIPADKRVTFFLPTPYVGSNPAVATFKNGAVAANSVNVIGFRHVDSWLATSAESLPVIVQRYSSSWPWSPLLADFTTLSQAPVLGFNTVGTATIGATVSGTAATQGTIPFAYGPASYVIGASQVASFTAVPDTLLTNQIPSYLAVSMTTTAAIFLPAVANVATNSVPGIVITSNQGVFKSNVGSPLNPSSFGPGATGLIRPATCTSASFFTDSWGTLFILPFGNNIANTPGCTIGTSTLIQFQVPATALLPNPSTGTTVTFDVRVMPSIIQAVGAGAFTAGGTNTIGDTASLMNQPGYTTTAVCGTSSAPSYQAGAVNDLNTAAYASRCALVNGISAISPVTAGVMQCPAGATVSNAGNLVTFTKIPEGLWSTNIWPLTNYNNLGVWAQSVGLTGSPPVYITSWGHMFSTPMYAVSVSYPPNANSLNSLGITSTQPANYQLAFIIKMNRITMFCSSADTMNPWTFQVGTCQPVALVYAYSTVGSSGVPVQSLAGSTWGTGNCMVFVTLTQGGAVVGWYSTTGSPTSDSGSDDALFGLLALIAIPLLLCCCLLWALWYFRPRAEPCPCPMVPEYPVQEVYWVNPQPMVAPVAAYPQAVPLAAPLSAPPTTPIYLVQ